MWPAKYFMDSSLKQSIIKVSTFSTALYILIIKVEKDTFIWNIDTIRQALID